MKLLEWKRLTDEYLALMEKQAVLIENSDMLSAQAVGSELSRRFPSIVKIARACKRSRSELSENIIENIKRIRENLDHSLERLTGEYQRQLKVVGESRSNRKLLKKYRGRNEVRSRIQLTC